MNSVNRIKFLIISGFVLGTIAMMGCGKDTTESAGKAADTVVTDETEEVPPVDRKTQYEELYRENAVLWNDYCDLLMEVSYYEAPYREEIIKEDTYVPASEKLKQTAADNPKWLRPVVDLSSEVGEIEIPYVTESELDAKIAELTEQNETIKEETERLIPVRDALKATYGVEMSIGDVEIAEGIEPIDEEELRAENESRRPFEAAGPSSGLGSDTAGDDSSGGAGSAGSGGVYSTDMTCEEMFKKGGWTIISGSGDIVSAKINTGEDTYTVETGSDYIYISAHNIYGEGISMNGFGDMQNIRRVVSYMMTNGAKSIFTAGDFGMYWSGY